MKTIHTHEGRFPLVSVIIPNYNHARFLDQRLQSVLDQTYRNIEVIILDDCSTDNSLEVIEKYRSDTRIVDVIVNEKNSGNTFLQWDKGIHLAQGELVWIAESDDYCELNMLEELVKAISKHSKTVIAYTDMVSVNESGDPLTPWKDFPHSPIKKGEIAPTANYTLIRVTEKIKFTNRYLTSRRFTKKYLAFYCAIKNASGTIFRKEPALNLSDKYITIKAAGDYMFWTELAQRGHIAVINRPLSYFRRHAQTVSYNRNIDGTNLKAEFEIYNWIRQQIHFSYLRKLIVMSQRASKLKRTPFVNETVQKEIYDIWKVERYSSKMNKVINWVCEKAYYYFRVHI